jgi:GntR family transcriptional regulator, transcriptional repressor for pyruvate dehydrogenase complex
MQHADRSPVPTAPGEEGNNSVFAVERLRDFLRTYDIPADGRLPTERQFSEIFGTGRRAVRRALEALESEGLISRRQGSGTFFGQPASHEMEPLPVSATDFVEIMEVRLRLEPQLAQLAAMRAKPEHVARMHALAAKIAQSHDADERELWDGMLHRLIAQAAGNRLFLSLFDTVNRIRQDESWRAIRERARSSSNSLEKTTYQHMRIVEAIGRHDPVAAGEQMREHLLMLQELLIRQTSLDGEIPGGDQTSVPIGER